MECNREITPKEEIIILENKLKENFQYNFKYFIKTYNKNRSRNLFLKYFIKSNILIDNFENLYLDYKNINNKKNIFQKIIYDYFDQDKIVNIKFIQMLKEKDFDLFQDIFYKKQVYSKIKHITSFSKIFSKYDKFLKLAYFLNNIENKILVENKVIEDFLKNIKLDDLLILVYFHINIFSLESKKNGKNYEIKNWDRIGSLILNKKINLDNKNCYKVNEKELINKVDTNNMVDPNKEKIKEIFNHFKEVIDFDELLVYLKYNEFNYYFIDENTLKILPKDMKTQVEFNKAGEKEDIYMQSIDYFIKKDIQKCKGDYLNKETASNMERNNYFINLLLGEEIILNNNRIKFSHMIWLISKLRERNKRLFGEKINMSNIEESIYRIGIDNFRNGNTWNYINIRNKKDLINASLLELKEKLNIELSPEEIVSIFDFFSTDINDAKGEEVNLIKKPFLKIEDNYIWSYTSLEYKELYKFITINLLSKPQEKDNYINKISEHFENKICKLFKENDFKAISQKNSNKFANKDIDVLAHKDGFLFIVETKITYTKLDYNSVKIHTEKTLKNAENQLKERVKNYLDYLDDETLEILEIKNPSTLKIVPLIITNSFEGKCIRDNNIYKLNEIELRMYLEKKSSELLIKMIEEDFYWNIFNKDELALRLNCKKLKIKNLKVIQYV